MKLVFVAGSWGSGTTAVTGALDRLGVQTMGPFLVSNDPRTENTFELLPFRRIVLAHVDEPTLAFRDSYPDGFVAALETFRDHLQGLDWPQQPGVPERVFALKMPLASLCLPALRRVFDMRLVVVHRSLKDIEASRLRRHWPALFGEQGARQIYDRLFDDILACGQSCLGISYTDFVAEPRQALERIVGFCGLEYLRPNLEQACAFVRRR